MLQKGLCVDCGACVGICPYFKSHAGKIAMLFSCNLPQGRCHAHCPKVELDLERITQATFGKPYDGSPLGHYSEIKKARAGARLQGRGRFQNGGSVTALIAFALKSETIAAAALTGSLGLTPVPVLATSEAEVIACAGTKYMAAPSVASVNDYLRSGIGNLGVVGTPCQIAAVAQARLNPLNKPGFRDVVALTIGLFCTWAVDTRSFGALVGDKTDACAVTAMDVPPPPASVMEITTTSASYAIPLDEIRKTIPGGCAICPDMTAELADVSVGAMEGEPTWNTLIIRSARGAALVEQAVRGGYLELADLPLASQENLARGAAGKKKRALLKAREDRLLNVDPASGRSAMLIDDSVVQRILAG